MLRTEPRTSLYRKANAFGAAECCDRRHGRPSILLRRAVDPRIVVSRRRRRARTRRLGFWFCRRLLIHPPQRTIYQLAHLVARRADIVVSRLGVRDVRKQRGNGDADCQQPVLVKIHCTFPCLPHLPKMSVASVLIYYHIKVLLSIIWRAYFDNVYIFSTLLVTLDDDCSACAGHSLF